MVDILSGMFCTRCGAANAAHAQFCHSCGGPIALATVAAGPVSVAIPGFHYGGFWLRFWAYLIDSLILGALPMVVGLIMVPLFFAGAGALALVGLWVFIVPLVLCEGWLYYAFMESSHRQATFGKQALGLKVSGMQGERISFGRATGRYFGKIPSHAMLNFGFIIAGFTEKKQALHDMLASCLVVRA